MPVARIAFWGVLEAFERNGTEGVLLSLSLCCRSDRTRCSNAGPEARSIGPVSSLFRNEPGNR